MSIDISTDLLAPLRALFGGALVLPGEPGRDEARESWQLSVDHYPAAVADHESQEDLVQTAQARRELELRVAGPLE